MEDDDSLHVNPCPPDWLTEEQKATLRGDTVEGTAYNERWILQTLSDIYKTLLDLLPTLQNATNLTTYDFTPMKTSPMTQEEGDSTPVVTPSTQAHSVPSYDTPASAHMQDDAEISANSNKMEVNPNVVEIPTAVEKACCLLWDMCAEKKVAIFVLTVCDSVIVQMLQYSLIDTTALRLTEILCGIVRNICCHAEGCEAVLNCPYLVGNLVNLPENCTDTDVLIQSFNLLYMLVCHANDYAEQNSDKPQSKNKHKITIATALHDNVLEQFISFTIQNNLNDEFVCLSLKLLHKLLFLSDLLHGDIFIAHHYASDALVESLINVVKNWHREMAEKEIKEADPYDSDDEDHSALRTGDIERMEESVPFAPNSVHFSIYCLFGLSNTKAVDVLVASEEKESCFEPSLAHYVQELVAVVENEVRSHKNHRSLCDDSSALHIAAERLNIAVQLLVVLKRSLRLPDVMMCLARLLTLLEHSGICELQGDTSMTISSEQTAKEEKPTTSVNRQISSDSAKSEEGSASKTKKEKSKRKSENKLKNKAKSIFDQLDLLTIEKANRKVEKKERKINKKQLKRLQSFETKRKNSRRRRRSAKFDESFEDFNLVEDSKELICLSVDTTSELLDMRKSLEQYFAHHLHYWFTFGDLSETDGILCTIVKTLDQCTVPEALLVLESTKRIDDDLVAKIQEKMLDVEKFPRLVALLSQLYE